MAARTPVTPDLANQSVTKPGVHSHNFSRALRAPRTVSPLVTRLRLILFLLGLAGIGYYGFTLSNEYVYQTYENWAFDQKIAGHPDASFADYLRERTPVGFLVGEKAPRAPAASVATGVTQPSVDASPALAEGSVLGRISVGRLNLSAIVRQGVTAKTLSEAVGHVPSTALPGEAGNFAIAAHRDTLFRALKDIKKDDLVTFESDSATYTYKIVATRIVTPSDVSVIRPDGGGLIVNDNPARDKLLTMITCYPFYYVGSAPKRFIVEGSLVQSEATASLPENLERPAFKPLVRPPVVRTRISKQANTSEPRRVRGFSHLTAGRKLKVMHGYRPAAGAPHSDPPKKKRGFWRRLFGSLQG